MFYQNQQHTNSLQAPCIMYTMYLKFSHFQSHFLPSPWKPHDFWKFWNCQKNCGSIPLWINHSFVTKSDSFGPKRSPEVRISRFPWQPIGIFKFRFRDTDLWPGQIVCAKFCRNPSRNQGGDANHPSPVHKMSHKNWGLLYRLGAWPSPRVLSMGLHDHQKGTIRAIVWFYFFKGLVFSWQEHIMGT